MLLVARVQVVMDAVERERFRQQADQEGRSLSEWLRVAGRERLQRAQPARLRSAEDVQAFFAAIDERHAADPPEDDWSLHKARIAASRVAGLPTGL